MKIDKSTGIPAALAGLVSFCALLGITWGFMRPLISEAVAGNEEGERSIMIYSGSAADIAIALKPDGLAALGLSPKKIARAKKLVDRFYEDFEDFCHDNGIPYERHDPHPENIPHEHE